MPSSATDAPSPATAASIGSAPHLRQPERLRRAAGRRTGGRFVLAPEGDFSVERRYLAKTNGKRMADGPIGRRRWAVAEIYIPTWGNGPEPELTSHESACLLNAGETDAHVRITVSFADRDPVGPYALTVPARRTQHVRFKPARRHSGDSPRHGRRQRIEADVPIVVQHIRLAPRQTENAVLSTTAYASND